MLTSGKDSACSGSDLRYEALLLQPNTPEPDGGMRRLHAPLKWTGLVFCLFSFFSSLNYANASDVWSRLRHSVLLVVLLRHWVPLQWMHTTVHSTKSPPKGSKEFKAFKRQKGLSWDFLCTLKRRIKYKFPIGACYGCGSHIKALCWDIKAAWVVPEHHMHRRNENNLEKRWFCNTNHWMLFLTRHWGNKEFKEVIFDQVFCLNRL